jgi:serine/threonine protein kinase/tetratricopeptide (TPR) repeat protein
MFAFAPRIMGEPLAVPFEGVTRRRAHDFSSSGPRSHDALRRRMLLAMSSGSDDQRTLMPDELSSLHSLTAPRAPHAPHEVHDAEARSSLAAPSIPSSEGRRIAGRYEILGLIGAGGMGTVYRARDAELDEVVALKVLRRELVGSDEALERFRREAKLARRVTHRNVARTFDIGEHEGERFLTMELVDGESLSAVLGRQARTPERTLPIARVVAVLDGVCQGLAAAHEAGVVHRDLKPDNVLLARDGRVVITDFGVARAWQGESATATLGAVVGTPAYMSPEQVQGVTTDARADLYALGVMLFELLTGELPFSGDTIFAVAAARLVGPPPDPRARRADVPSALAELAVRLLARSPDDRPRHAREVALMLGSVTLPAVVAPAPPPSRGGHAPGAGASVIVTPTSVTPTSVTPSGASGGAGGSGASSAASGELSKTVAVLPFENQSTADDAHLAQGLTEDLTDSLCSAKGLRVRPLSSVAQLVSRAGKVDPREVGRELGVHVVVSGSVRRAGERLRVSVRVLSVSDGFQIWASRFDRLVSEIFVVGDEVAKSVAEALTADLRVAERQAPSNPEAIELYLRGRQLLGRTYDAAELDAVVELFDRAAALAPSDPMIQSGLALAHARRWFAGRAEAEGHARAAVAKAIELGPERGEALLARGMLHFQSGENVECVQALKGAIAAAPNLAEAHQILGSISLEVGLFEQGFRRLRAALLVDEGLARAAIELARVHALKGSFEVAYRELDLIIQKSPTAGRMAWVAKARAALWERDPERVRVFLEETQRQGHALATSILERFRVTDVDGAGSPVAQFLPLTGSSLRGLVLALQARAEVCGLAGDAERCLEFVEQAAQGGLIDIGWLDLCPLLQLVRETPRFVAARALVQRRVEPIRAALA